MTTRMAAATLFSPSSLSSSFSPSSLSSSFSPSSLSSSFSLEPSRLLYLFLPNSHSLSVTTFKSSSSFTVRASSSSSSLMSNRFNITFGNAPSKAAKPKADLLASPQNNLFLIPWIVRDENGNLKMQTTPPDDILKAMAVAETVGKKKKKTSQKEKKVAKTVPSSPEPKHSKAARRFYNENFREPQRLSKVLAAAGVASRRASEELIFEGRVTVNGTICNSPQTRVDPFRDAIYVNGNRLPKKLPPKLHFALNKPKGYICSSGEKESKSILSLFDDYWKSWDKVNPGVPKPRLFTVGRLDVATTGLIIVTNDGDFTQRLTHPSSELAKEYIAAIEGTVSKRHLQAIADGVDIDGIHCTPDSVELLPAQPHNTKPRLRIVVHEGRNHEVRELVKNAGLELYSLKRVRIGGFRLPPDLGLGKHVELKEAELKLLAGKQAKAP